MKRVSAYLHWVPRILAVMLILFLAIFSLDVITPDATIWQILAGMFIHNIPVFALIAVLIVSWRYEWVGGVVFILAGLAYIALTASNQIPRYQAISWSMILAGPAILVGVLFLVNWFKKTRS